MATIRSGKFTHEQQRVWATQDLPIPIRAMDDVSALVSVGRLVNGGLINAKLTLMNTTLRRYGVTCGNADVKIEWRNGGFFALVAAGWIGTR